MTDKSKGGAGTPPGNNLKSTSIVSQRQRIISALREWTEGLTTIDFVERFNVMRPGARICELRHKFDFNIITVWTVSENAQGYKHRVARYVLLPGKYQGGAA